MKEPHDIEDCFPNDYDPMGFDSDDDGYYDDMGSRHFEDRYCEREGCCPECGEQADGVVAPDGQVWPHAALDEIERLRSRLAAAEGELRQAHDRDWTPSLCDRLNIIARENQLPECKDGPTACDLLAVVSGMYYTARTERDAARAEANMFKLAYSERVAQLTAHRVCCGTEHDPTNGKLHGCCVVCGVGWPCDVAKPLAAAPPPAEGNKSNKGDRK